MIFSYINIPYKIRKGQSFVNYIVLEILCRAHKNGMPNDFTESIIIDKYRVFFTDVNQNYIKDPITNSYSICRQLDKNDISLLRQAIHTNIQIQEICNGNIKPVLFEDIKKIDKRLANYLYVFCKSLYVEVMKLKPFTDMFGKLAEHYTEFATVNLLKTKRCPYCGYTRMLNEYNTKKEAYDHFLPKEQYPFISIHFNNLAPMCHTCNSSYKSRKNPIDIKRTGKRKKVFFSYANYGRIGFHVSLNNPDLLNIKPNEIKVQNSLLGYQEEIESWEEIFGIQERYKSIYSGESFNWLEEARIATKNFGETFTEHKSNLNNNYFSNENFLKLSLLEACERQKII